MTDGQRRLVLRPIAVAACIGAFLGGGCAWAWHGDWSDSGNPFAWNSAARSDFFSLMLLGGIFGAGVGLVITIVNRRRS
jgi:hypothetical protein